jgi:hypothetical protein
MIKILTYKVSEGNLTQFGGGVNQSLIKEAEEDVNKVIEALVDEDYEITDLKVNYFTAKRHNNGIADEVWVQFIICYNSSIFRVLQEGGLE